MIGRSRNGGYHCDGRACGYPLAWLPASPEDDEPGLWVCLDCNASMYGDMPEPAQAEARP